MAKPITAKSIKSKVVKQMKDLGTYRKEFELIIDIFAGMLYQSLGEVVEQEGDSVLTEVLKFKNELKKKRVKDG